jgi:hypothetical protein
MLLGMFEWLPFSQTLTHPEAKAFQLIEHPLTGIVCGGGSDYIVHHLHSQKIKAALTYLFGWCGHVDCCVDARTKHKERRGGRRKMEHRDKRLKTGKVNPLKKNASKPKLTQSKQLKKKPPIAKSTNEDKPKIKPNTPNNTTNVNNEANEFDIGELFQMKKQQQQQQQKEKENNKTSKGNKETQSRKPFGEDLPLSMYFHCC